MTKILLGGTLFFKVDGTNTQLLFFSDKFSVASPFWLGIWTEDHSVWYGLDNQPILDESLAWNKGEPTNPGSEEKRAASFEGGLLDIAGLYTLKFLCDLS